MVYRLGAGQFDTDGILLPATPEYLVLFGLEESSWVICPLINFAISDFDSDSVLRSLDQKSFTVEQNAVTRKNEHKCVRVSFIHAKPDGQMRLALLRSLKMSLRPQSNQ